jgi:hypothetical protein
MRTESRYQAAKNLSSTISEYFQKQIDTALKAGGKNLAPVPAAHLVENLIDTAFWASLRREEGNSPKISLAFLSPDHAGKIILFKERILFTPDSLTKLSLGVERPGVHLGVWFEGTDLFIWGTTTKIPDLCFVLDLSEPGLLVIKYRRLNGYGKFANVAVLSGDQVKIVNVESTTTLSYPDILKMLLGHSKDLTLNMLVQLAVSMRSHKHGGTLLVVPQYNTSWKTSILHPIKYEVLPSYTGISDLLELDEGKINQTEWQSSMRSEIDRLAGLTAVDGATIISDNYKLMAFGAKIIRADGNKLVENVLMQEPILGGEPSFVNPGMSGGTRHLSAAQFVHDQPDTVALVASQDGHFTVFSWLAEKKMVQGHRIETLLL